MSEIGPMSVRFPFLWRMISCAAANGIICSNCNPIASEELSSTNSAIASCMERSLVIAVEIDMRCSGVFPLGSTLLQKCADALLRVFCRHQFFKINLFSAGETFFEVHRLPPIACLFCECQGRGTYFRVSVDNCVEH